MKNWAFAIGVLVVIMLLPLVAAVTFVAVLAPASSNAACADPVGGVAGGWRPPAVSRYSITADFGQAGGRWSSGTHTGIDLAILGADRRIVAAAAGTVVTAGYHGAYGNQAVIEHGNGISTRYGHLAMPARATVGQRVKAGQQLGVEGATGNVTGAHLHFEVIDHGAPIDPAPFMAEHGAALDGSPVVTADSVPSEIKSGVKHAGAATVTGVRSDGQEVTLRGEQLANAATIADVGRESGVSERGLIVALMAALQESGLRNLDHGDRDSLGLFQQRAGWGSFTDRQTPQFAVRAFFGGRAGPNSGSPPGLLDVPGWERMGLGEAAQAVQISAYPGLYERWEPVARAVLSAVGGSLSTGCGVTIAGELRVATWNVCLQFCERLGSWRGRLPAIARQILASDADVVALQETGKRGTHGKALLKAVKSRYRLAAYRRSRMILYNPDRVSAIAANGRRLPSRTLSIGGRFGVFQVLRVKATGRAFVMSSLHPVQGSSAHAERQRVTFMIRALTVAKMLSSGARPILLAGDFNTHIPSIRVQGSVDDLLATHGYQTAEQRAETREGQAFNSYNGGRAPSRGRRIDHVVVKDEIVVNRWRQEVTASDALPPSDHNLVTVDLAFNK